MSTKNTKSEKKKTDDEILASMRAPWIQKKTGTRVIIAISIALVILVAYQVISDTGNWGEGLLYGLLFGGSIWLVFFGMSWFHNMMNKQK